MRSLGPYAELARRAWDATARGDVASLLKAYAPEVVMWVRGQNPQAGEYKGRAAILEQFGRLAERVEEMSMELLEIYEGEDGALIHYRVRSSRGELRLDAEYYLSFRAAQGQIYEVEIVPVDPAQTNAFWNAIEAL